MVTQYGMSLKIGPITVREDSPGNPFLGREMGSPRSSVSAHVRNMVDEEVQDPIFFGAWIFMCSSCERFSKAYTRTFIFLSSLAAQVSRLVLTAHSRARQILSDNRHVTPDP
jgi:hypothetical protein